jgi:hypothetical protein
MQTVARFIASVWLATLGSAAVSSAVQAGTITMVDHGGSPTAGSDYSIDCGDDLVLIGVRVRKGWWLDRIEGLCTRLTRDRRWVGDLRSTGEAGGYTADEARGTCPRNTAVRALRGRFGSYVNRLILRCRPLVSGVAAATIRVQGSQRGEQSWDYEFCPGGAFARGFHGRAGNYIDRAGLICHSGDTPNLQGPPDNLRVVNVDPQAGLTSPVPTAAVKVTWTDRSTAETAFRISIITLISTTTFATSIIRPAVSGAGTDQEVTINNLPSGRYGLKVCARFGGGDTPEELCSLAQPQFAIAGGQLAAGRGAPTVISVTQDDAVTDRVRWSHNFTNPRFFDVRARCGDSPFGTVKSTEDGTAREETFVIGIGPGQLQVCAQYSEPEQSACSALFAFQCN